MFPLIKADWCANKGNAKGRIILLLFRLAGVPARRKKWVKVLFLPYLIFYRVIVEWILGVEIPWKTKIGPGLRLYHGVGLVVNDSAIIGSNCILRHGVTIGVKHTSDSYDGGAPVIGSGVDIGAGCIILGPISIGDNSSLGAGAVVTKSVPPGGKMVGNPAKNISKVQVANGN